MDTPFIPYECSLGIVIAHQPEPPAYIIVTGDGRTIGIPANGTPSPEAVEGDIATPPIPPPLPRSQPASVVVRRLTAEELTALRTSTHPEAFRAYLLATSEGVISEADPDYSALVSLLDQLGIIAAGRWAALLA